MYNGKGKAMRRTLRKQLRQGMDRSKVWSMLMGGKWSKGSREQLSVLLNGTKQGKMSALSTTLIEKADLLFRRHLGPRMGDL